MWNQPRLIAAHEVPGLLLQACPSFAAAWETVQEENLDDKSQGGRLGYLDAGDFIRHLAELALAGRYEEFPGVFDFIEKLIIEGDAYVSELGVIGYLEGMQMATVTSRGLDPETVFRPWLRPTSAKYWLAINLFWETGAPIPHIAPETPPHN